MSCDHEKTVEIHGIFTTGAQFHPTVSSTTEEWMPPIWILIVCTPLRIWLWHSFRLDQGSHIFFRFAISYPNCSLLGKPVWQNDGKRKIERKSLRWRELVLCLLQKSSGSHPNSKQRKRDVFDWTSSFKPGERQTMKNPCFVTELVWNQHEIGINSKHRNSAQTTLWQKSKLEAYPIDEIYKRINLYNDNKIKILEN